MSNPLEPCVNCRWSHGDKGCWTAPNAMLAPFKLDDYVFYEWLMSHMTIELSQDLYGAYGIDMLQELQALYKSDKIKNILMGTV